MKRISILFCTVFAILFGLSAQQAPAEWYFQDAVTSEYGAIGIDHLYEYLGERKPSQQVIVAILDSGVDIEHPDLKENIWVNTDEIPGNGIDDDKNGYMDDVNGWNFLGNAEGQNITKSTLEITRLYAHYRDYFAKKDLKKLSKKDEKLYADFLEWERVVQTQREQSAAEIEAIEQNLGFIRVVIDTFNHYYPNQELTPEFLESFDAGDNQLLNVSKELFKNALEFGLELTTTEALLKEIESSYKEALQASKDNLDYRYNPDFKSRALIGDNYEDQTECCYGNGNVRGGFAFHGTVVSGIVGAAWDEKGIRGIAKDVKVMPIRTVPNGDEHDKDVANAIRYAVDNGAHVINMSFGKGQSWNKKVVDDAVRYARKHDVLLVHGAGNDGEDNDVVSNYPNASFEKSCLFGKKMADNWIEVGATSTERGENSIAYFSNYGKTQVDIFAPGMEIYSTAPDGNYDYAQGTSFSSPVLAGVAAIIRGYFPNLKAHEVKEVLMQSVSPLTGEVYRPGDEEKVPGSELSKSGGVVNAYNAFILAEQKSKGEGMKQAKAKA